MAGELILILEDEPRIAAVLERYLQADGFRCEVAGTGRRALELWRGAHPDLLLLDLMVPDIDGLEVARRVRGESSLPIIMLTARGEELDRLLGLELGADDYIPKPFSPREVVARVKAVLRRARGDVRPPARLLVGSLELDLNSFECRCHEETLDLTPLQLRLLAVLAASPGRVYPRREIMDALREGQEDERVIDAHVKNLRQRLGACAEQLETIRGVGYRLRP